MQAGASRLVWADEEGADVVVVPYPPLLPSRALRSAVPRIQVHGCRKGYDTRRRATATDPGAVRPLVGQTTLLSSPPLSLPPPPPLPILADSSTAHARSPSTTLHSATGFDSGAMATRRRIATRADGRSCGTTKSSEVAAERRASARRDSSCDGREGRSTCRVSPVRLRRRREGSRAAGESNNGVCDAYDTQKYARRAGRLQLEVWSGSLLHSTCSFLVVHFLVFPAPAPAPHHHTINSLTSCAASLLPPPPMLWQKLSGSPSSAVVQSLVTNLTTFAILPSRGVLPSDLKRSRSAYIFVLEPVPRTNISSIALRVPEGRTHRHS